MANLIEFMDNNETKIVSTRGPLLGAHTSDAHFGVTGIAVQEQYIILKEQFVEPIKELPIDYVAINGDTFDHKSMSSSDMVMYAIKFVNDIVYEVCQPKGIPLIIIGGTYNHDANQLKLFYHLMENKAIDVRIIENIQFTYIKTKTGGMAKVLCIPELYGINESVYREFLFESGLYDMCLMHGTIKGSVPQDKVGEGRLFHIEDFINCMGPVIAGHVHGGGCFNKHFYYCGSPYSWRFDDDYRKGFLLTAHNLDSHQYYVHKELIHSFRYETINLDFMLEADPKSIIDYINKLKEDEGIDYIKITFEKEVSPATKQAINNFLKNSKDKAEFNFTKQDKIVKENLARIEELQKYSYLYDKGLNPYDKFARYINESMGEVVISGDELKELAEEEI